MNPQRQHFTPEIFIVIVILFLHLITNIVWLSLDAFPFGADELAHLDNGMTISRVIKDPIEFFGAKTIKNEALQLIDHAWPRPTTKAN